MKFSESPILALRLPVWRARLMLIGFIGAFLLLLGRAAYLQAMNEDFLQAKGESRYSRVLEVPATRGKILDRNGDALAISTPVKSIWAIPEDVQASGRDLAELAKLLDQPRDALQKRLADTKRDFVYLKRQVAPAVADQIALLDIPGVHQSREYRRYYPGGEVMAHVLGFTNADDAGQEGIELAFQEHLAGQAGSRRVIKDRRGHIVEDVESIKAARDGKDLVLALDSRIQSLAYGELREAVTAHRAKGGAIVVVDVRTGEVLALANLPTYNPNNRAGLTGAQLRNRAVTDMFEPGSTLKPITVALALERGAVTPKTTVNVAPGSLTIGPATIRDAHYKKEDAALTVAEVIQKSSNVGSAKLALDMPAEAMYELFHDIGFGVVPHLGFPGEAAGRVRPYQNWRPIEQATMSYGHGITVSLVQLARAYTVFAQDGLLMPLSLVKVDQPPAGKRVLSAQTARAVRRMLELAVQPGGTGPRAQIMGYRVAGKTGTAHKLVDGRYARDKYVASFVGFAPASDPRLVIAVVIDEPKGSSYYGGLVAAPVFADVMSGSLRRLGVSPDAPMEPIELPPPGAEIRESV